MLDTIKADAELTTGTPAYMAPEMANGRPGRPARRPLRARLRGLLAAHRPDGVRGRQPAQDADPAHPGDPVPPSIRSGRPVPPGARASSSCGAWRRIRRGRPGERPTSSWRSSTGSTWTARGTRPRAREWWETQHGGAGAARGAAAAAGAGRPVTLSVLRRAPVRRARALRRRWRPAAAAAPDEPARAVRPRAPPADRWELPKALQRDQRARGGQRGPAVRARRRAGHHLPARSRHASRGQAVHASAGPPLRGDFEAIAVVGDQRDPHHQRRRAVCRAAKARTARRCRTSMRATGVGRRCEVEGLAYEPAGRALLFACKTPRSEALRGPSRGVRAGRSSGRRSAPRPRICSCRSRGSRGRSGATSFHPSELLRDPGDGHYLMLSRRASTRSPSSRRPGRWSAVAQLRGTRSPAGGRARASRADGALLVSDEASGKRATLTVYPRVH